MNVRLFITVLVLLFAHRDGETEDADRAFCSFSSPAQGDQVIVKVFSKHFVNHGLIAVKVIYWGRAVLLCSFEDGSLMDNPCTATGDDEGMYRTTTDLSNTTLSFIIQAALPERQGLYTIVIHGKTAINCTFTCCGEPVPGSSAPPNIGTEIAQPKELNDLKGSKESNTGTILVGVFVASIVVALCITAVVLYCKKQRFWALVRCFNQSTAENSIEQASCNGFEHPVNTMKTMRSNQGETTESNPGSANEQAPRETEENNAPMDLEARPFLRQSKHENENSDQCGSTCQGYTEIPTDERVIQNDESTSTDSFELLPDSKQVKEQMDDEQAEIDKDGSNTDRPEASIQEGHNYQWLSGWLVKRNRGEKPEANTETSYLSTLSSLLWTSGQNVNEKPDDNVHDSDTAAQEHPC